MGFLTDHEYGLHIIMSLGDGQRTKCSVEQVSTSDNTRCVHMKPVIFYENTLPFKSWLSNLFLKVITIASYTFFASLSQFSNDAPK